MRALSDAFENHLARIYGGKRAFVMAMWYAGRASIGAFRHYRKIRWAEVSRVVFVCKGNICRSPFAADYARRILPERISVASAGYYPEPSRRCPSGAVTVASSFGVDLSDHRSTVLDRVMAEGAGLIFVFDDENHERLVRDFPQVRDRVFFTGSLCDDDEFAIPDPWGGDAVTFERCYTTISRYSIIWRP